MHAPDRKSQGIVFIKFIKCKGSDWENMYPAIFLYLWIAHQDKGLNMCLRLLIMLLSTLGYTRWKKEVKLLTLLKILSRTFYETLSCRPRKEAYQKAVIYFIEEHWINIYLVCRRHAWVQWDVRKKIKTLWERDLSMMLQGELPTSNYLTNPLPTKTVQGNMTPILKHSQNIVQYYHIWRYGV